MDEVWLNLLGWWIAAGVVVSACLKTLYANPQHKIKVFLQLVVYYAKYWVLWLWCWAMFHLWLEPQAFYLLTLLFALFYLYISWIEPNRIQIRQQTISLTDTANANPDVLTTNQNKQPLKLAVIGDIHIGIFSTPKQLQHLVHQLNSLDVDAILVTGDWLYHAGSDIIGHMLVLKALNKPCFSVLSEADNEQLQSINHRYDGGNYMLANERITQVLTTLGITLLNDQIVNFKNMQLIGRSEVGSIAHQTTLPVIKPNQPTIILTHDIKEFLANSQHLNHLTPQTLIIGGQTHGGQMNLPWLTPWLVSALTGNSTIDGLKRQTLNVDFATPNLIVGKSDTKNTNSKTKTTTFYSWTNTGIGMTGLPFRFRCPPRIDVLTIV